MDTFKWQQIPGELKKLIEKNRIFHARFRISSQDGLYTDTLRIQPWMIKIIRNKDGHACRITIASFPVSVVWEDPAQSPSAPTQLPVDTGLRPQPIAEMQIL